MSGASKRNLFDRPIFILSTPRSGSTLLFETLAAAPNLFTTGDESHQLIESQPALIPAFRGWDSNRLSAEDAQPDVAETLAERFYARLHDREGHRPEGRVRMLEKTPKNALRVPFFHAIWPDAVFVYLYRDPRQTLASMIRGWESGRFRTYPRLPDWPGLAWSFLLVPGWADLRGLPVAEIAARQWATTTNMLVNDLSAVPPQQLRVIDYNDFLADPQGIVTELASSLDLAWDRELPSSLPPSRMTLTMPGKDKWQELGAEIGAVWPLIADADERAWRFVDEVKKSNRGACALKE